MGWFLSIDPHTMDSFLLYTPVLQAPIKDIFQAKTTFLLFFLSFFVLHTIIDFSQTVQRIPQLALTHKKAFAFSHGPEA